MAKKKKHEEETQGEGYHETESHEAEEKEQRTQSSDERKESNKQRKQQLIDNLTEKHKEHFEAAQEKVDNGEDATAELAAAQESNQMLIRVKATDEETVPAGQNSGAVGAAGTCVCGPFEHEVILAAGGEVVDEIFSGSATINEIAAIPPLPEPPEGEGERHKEAA